MTVYGFRVYDDMGTNTVIATFVFDDVQLRDEAVQRFLKINETYVPTDIENFDSHVITKSDNIDNELRVYSVYNTTKQILNEYVC